MTANTRGLIMKAPVVSDSKVHMHTEDGVLYVMGRLNSAEIDDLNQVLQQVGNITKIVTLIDNVDQRSGYNTNQNFAAPASYAQSVLNRLQSPLILIQLNRLMFHKVGQFKTQLSDQILEVQQRYKDFRIYDFGSYALNRLTPKQGYSVETQLAYGLKTVNVLICFKSSAFSASPLIVFVHGGAWLHGDKRITTSLARPLLKKVMMWW